MEKTVMVCDTIFAVLVLRALIYSLIHQHFPRAHVLEMLSSAGDTRPNKTDSLAFRDPKGLWQHCQ